MVTIKVRQNGSLLVEGDDVKLIDWNGNEYYVPTVEREAVLRQLSQTLQLSGGGSGAGSEGALITQESSTA
jgi:hypothetical protein